MIAGDAVASKRVSLFEEISDDLATLEEIKIVVEMLASIWEMVRSGL
ncbi:hypothetical protein [Halobellus sp. EA9]